MVQKQQFFQGIAHKKNHTGRPISSLNHEETRRQVSFGSWGCASHEVPWEFDMLSPLSCYRSSANIALE